MQTFTLPILAIRKSTSVLFPGLLINIDFGREVSIKAIRDVVKGDGKIIIAFQKDMEEDDPGTAKLWVSGIEASIKNVIDIPSVNSERVRVQFVGLNRVMLKKIKKQGDYNVCEFTRCILESGDILEEEALFAMNLQSFLFDMESVMSFKPSRKPTDLLSLSKFIDKLIYVSGISFQNKIILLSIINPVKRQESFQKMLKIFEKNQIEKQTEEKSLFSKASSKKIQKPLTDAVRLKGLAEKTKMTEEAKKLIDRELKKLSGLNPAISEYSVSLNYIETVLSLPWGKSTEDVVDLKSAKEILDEDHYGLEKPKERIIEFLAVRKLRPEKSGSILCFSGPPGVGKTSIAKSIARAMGRKFIRMSVGALGDEAEIRGHRRTYVGSMPGKIITNIIKAKSINPVFVLDEVDKMGFGGGSSRGDPAAALLEVLDPEQNSTFVDSYLNLGFDLSQVLFIATVNNLNALHPALRDRMDIVEIDGYTSFDKIKIARHYLIPKQKNENGLDDVDISISASALEKIIDEYTIEAGVRSLERECGNLLRKIAVNVVMENEIQQTINAEDVSMLLGSPKIKPKKMAEFPEVGVTTGLAWTSYGGTLLFIESIAKKYGNGKIEYTGSLGDVMKESIQLVHSWVKANTEDLNIDREEMDKTDIHVHFPSGAVPKDGPSAGVAITASIVSLLRNVPVRNDIAVTGEVSLRGKVLPIGGVREKILSAYRAGIREVAIPKDNSHDISRLPKEVMDLMVVHFIDNVFDAVELLLVNDIQPSQNIVS